MYQALYRKYRPKTFSEVVGQSHITDTLQRQVAESRVGHAYLFTGTRGTGKTTCARILAKADDLRASCGRRALLPVRQLPGHRRRYAAGCDGVGRRLQRQRQ